MILYLIQTYWLVSLIYAVPLSFTWLLVWFCEQRRFKLIDAVILLWCVSFPVVFWEIAQPFARTIPPHTNTSPGDIGPIFENWIQLLVAPGIQGFISAGLFWYATRKAYVFVTIVLATLAACLVLDLLQLTGEGPAAIVWNIAAVTGVASTILTRPIVPRNWNACPRCGYGRSGLKKAICPECGPDAKAT